MDNESSAFGPPPDDDLLRAFLLGRLDEQRASRVENHFFASDEVFERLLAIETELVDDAIAGSLSADDYEALRQRCDTPTGRRLWQASAAFQQAVAALPQPPATAAPLSRKWLIAAAILVIVLGGLVVELLRQRRIAADSEIRVADISQQIETLRAEAERARGAAAPMNGPTVIPVTPVVPPPQDRAEHLFAVTLQTGTFRDTRAVANRVNPPADATTLLLRLSLDEAPPGSYRVVLETVEGASVWSQTVSFRDVTRPTVLPVAIPLALLHPADYIIALRRTPDPSQSDPIASYTFQLIR